MNMEINWNVISENRNRDKYIYTLKHTATEVYLIRHGHALSM